MKKNMMKVAFVAAIAMVSGVCFMNSQKSETLSEVALANVEALADFIMNPKDCEVFKGKECYVLVTKPGGSLTEVYSDQRNKNIVDF